MKQQINLEDAKGRPPLLGQELLKHFCEGKKTPPVRPGGQAVTTCEGKPPKDETVHCRTVLSSLQQAPVFEGLQEKSLQRLLSSAMIRSVSKGEKIIRHGDDVKFLYCILDGSVNLFRSSPEGKDASICLLKTGDTFMESAIFMEGPSPASCKTIQPCRLLLIPADIVRQQALRCGQLRTNMLRAVARHYKNAMQHIDNLVTKTSVARLGHYFLKQRLEQGPDSLHLELQSSKSIIASHLGMQPETFSRTLTKLRALGIVASANSITLEESHALCYFCDQETAYNCQKNGTPGCKGSGPANRRLSDSA